MDKSLVINYNIKSSEVPSLNWQDVSVKDLYEYMDKRVFEGNHPYYLRTGSIYPKDTGYILQDSNIKDTISDSINQNSNDSFKQKLDSKMKKLCLDTKLQLVSIEKIQEYINDDNKFVFIEEGLRDWNLKFKNGLYVSVTRENKDISYFLEYYKIVDDCCRKDLSILDKSWVIIGGGAILDIFGLIASMFKVSNFTFIPTSLNSMVSASIGGWVRVNVLGVDEKRIGTFYPANEILVCRDFLETLDVFYMYEGLMESIRLALVSKDKKLIEDILCFIKEYELERSAYRFKNISEDLLENIIKIKISFVEKDPLGKNERLLLGLGNELASILNKINYSHHGNLSLGESLAIGLYWCFFVSKQLGYISNNDYSYYIDVLKRSNTLVCYEDLCFKLGLSLNKEDGLDVCSDESEDYEEKIDSIFSSMINNMIVHETLKKDSKEGMISMILLNEDGGIKEYIDIEHIEKYWNKFLKGFNSLD